MSARSDIVHRIQPTSRSCGQTCLAMILGIPVRDVFVTLPRTRATNGQQLRRFLAARGRASRREVAYRGELPAIALVRVLWFGPGRRGHWIVRSRGRFYDPITQNEFWAVTEGRIVGYIEVL